MCIRDRGNTVRRSKRTGGRFWHPDAAEAQHEAEMRKALSDELSLLRSSSGNAVKSLRTRRSAAGSGKIQEDAKKKKDDELKQALAQLTDMCVLERASSNLLEAIEQNSNTPAEVYTAHSELVDALNTHSEATSQRSAVVSSAVEGFWVMSEKQTKLKKRMDKAVNNCEEEKQRAAGLNATVQQLMSKLNETATDLRASSMAVASSPDEVERLEQALRRSNDQIEALQREAQHREQDGALQQALEESQGRELVLEAQLGEERERAEGLSQEMEDMDATHSADLDKQAELRQQRKALKEEAAGLNKAIAEAKLREEALEERLGQAEAQSVELQASLQASEARAQGAAEAATVLEAEQARFTALQEELAGERTLRAGLGIAHKDQLAAQHKALADREAQHSDELEQVEARCAAAQASARDAEAALQAAEQGAALAHTQVACLREQREGAEEKCRLEALRVQKLEGETRAMKATMERIEQESTHQSKHAAELMAANSKLSEEVTRLRNQNEFMLEREEQLKDTIPRLVMQPPGRQDRCCGF
eukprot:TRINITY_DN3101_c0_g1_i7.p1 TRINITY_DN3101_c0_g1~~TRINITY_DN3101_c0_g1_i7.p1  ORF type:complete len:538 (-),score=218.06 TRINITY_DN3101_c0_g1_i7:210-1823(-)